MTLRRGRSEVQSLIFNKDDFTRDEAKRWALEHGYKAPKVDEKENTWRIRQWLPEKCPDIPGMKSPYRTISLTRGVQAALCIKKKR